MRRETLTSVFQRSPQEALEQAFAAQRIRCPWKHCDWLFCWQSTMGTDGVRYGSYKNVSRSMLQTRRHKLELADHAVSVLWLDVLFDPKCNNRILIADVI